MRAPAAVAGMIAAGAAGLVVLGAGTAAAQTGPDDTGSDAGFTDADASGGAGSDPFSADLFGTSSASLDLDSAGAEDPLFDPDDAGLFTAPDATFELAEGVQLTPLTGPVEQPLVLPEPTLPAELLLPGPENPAPADPAPDPTATQPPATAAPESPPAADPAPVTPAPTDPAPDTASTPPPATPTELLPPAPAPDNPTPAPGSTPAPPPTPPTDLLPPVAPVPESTSPADPLATPPLDAPTPAADVLGPDSAQPDQGPAGDPLFDPDDATLFTAPAPGTTFELAEGVQLTPLTEPVEQPLDLTAPVAPADPLATPATSDLEDAATADPAPDPTAAPTAGPAEQPAAPPLDPPADPAPASGTDGADDRTPVPPAADVLQDPSGEDGPTDAAGTPEQDAGTGLPAPEPTAPADEDTDTDTRTDPDPGAAAVPPVEELEEWLFGPEPNDGAEPSEDDQLLDYLREIQRGDQGDWGSEGPLYPWETEGPWSIDPADPDAPAPGPYEGPREEWSDGELTDGQRLVDFLHGLDNAVPDRGGSEPRPPWEVPVREVGPVSYQYLPGPDGRGDFTRITPATRLPGFPEVSIEQGPDGPRFSVTEDPADPLSSRLDVDTTAIGPDGSPLGDVLTSRGGRSEVPLARPPVTAGEFDAMVDQEGTRATATEGSFTVHSGPERLRFGVDLPYARTPSGEETNQVAPPRPGEARLTCVVGTRCYTFDDMGNLAVVETTVEETVRTDPPRTAPEARYTRSTTSEYRVTEPPLPLPEEMPRPSVTWVFTPGEGDEPGSMTAFPGIGDSTDPSSVAWQLFRENEMGEPRMARIVGGSAEATAEDGDGLPDGLPNGRGWLVEAPDQERSDAPTTSISQNWILDSWFNRSTGQQPLAGFVNGDPVDVPDLLTGRLFTTAAGIPEPANPANLDVRSLNPDFSAMLSGSTFPGPVVIDNENWLVYPGPDGAIYGLDPYQHEPTDEPGGVARGTGTYRMTQSGEWEPVDPSTVPILTGLWGDSPSSGSDRRPTGGDPDRGPGTDPRPDGPSGGLGDVPPTPEGGSGSGSRASAGDPGGAVAPEAEPVGDTGGDWVFRQDPSGVFQRVYPPSVPTSTGVQDGSPSTGGDLDRGAGTDDPQVDRGDASRAPEGGSGAGSRTSRGSGPGTTVTPELEPVRDPRNDIFAGGPPGEPVELPDSGGSTGGQRDGQDLDPNAGWRDASPERDLRAEGVPGFPTGPDRALEDALTQRGLPRGVFGFPPVPEDGPPAERAGAGEQAGEASPAFRSGNRARVVQPGSTRTAATPTGERAEDQWFTSSPPPQGSVVREYWEDYVQEDNGLPALQLVIETSDGLVYRGGPGGYQVTRAGAPRASAAPSPDGLGDRLNAFFQQAGQATSEFWGDQLIAVQNIDDNTVRAFFPGSSADYDRRTGVKVGGDADAPETVPTWQMTTPEDLLRLLQYLPVPGWGGERQWAF